VTEEIIPTTANIKTAIKNSKDDLIANTANIPANVRVAVSTAKSLSGIDGPFTNLIKAINKETPKIVRATLRVKSTI
jgi:hypothetical protein